MLMNSLWKRSRVWRYSIPPLAAALVVTLWLLIRPVNESIALGFLIGGMTTIVLLTTLQYLGRRRRAGMAGRVVTHQEDERDQAISLRAGATAGYLTEGVILVLAVVGALHPFRGIDFAAIALWSYIVALLAGYAIFARRS